MDEPLYDPGLIAAHTQIDAVYQHALCPIDAGNPFIEALPYPLTDADQIFNAYDQPLIEYNGDAERQLSAKLRMIRLSQLRQLRLPLPFQPELELYFHRTLCTSYRTRSLVHSENSILYEIPKGVDAPELHNQLKGDIGDAANSGIALIGYSECGKVLP